MFNSAAKGSTKPAVEPPSANAPARAVAPVERALAASVRLNELKPSVISEGFSFTGEVVADGPLHVEGRFKGTVRVSAATIGSNGSLDGTLECSNLRIKGSFDGDATCDELVLDATARVRGTIRYRSIAMSRGATVVGELQGPA